MRICPADIPNNGILFVDHEKNHRSGHLSHALVEYRKGRVMAFYSNCSGKRNPYCPGHNGFGWLEYRRSEDGGKSWGEPETLPYAMDSFLNEPFTVSCEKAVSPKEDTVVALCIRNENPNGWEPYLEPVALVSEDAGRTWSEPVPISDRRGRVYDAFQLDGVIYVLMLANRDFLTDSDEQRYLLYRSGDCGRSFELLSELPGEYRNHAYGSMVLREDGSLVAYIYNAADEFHMDYFVSRDLGRTWTETGKSFVAKRIRNPQIARTKEGYICHGRSGNSRDMPLDFVMYTGKDGIHWDEGRYLCHKDGAVAYYSNNLVLDHDDGSQTVLIQASVPYDGARVNICHWYLEIE